MHLVGDGFVCPTTILAPFTAGSNEVFLLLRWGIWASYLLLTYEDAIRTARRSEEAVIRGDELGPLHGLPISIKDTQMTKGVRTTLGSLVFKDRVPERDAAVVERVRDAGAIILGKTNVPEFGMVGTCENRLGGPGRNPWDTDRTPGGSSGGRGGRAVPDGNGQRRRWVDPHSGEFLRGLRHQANAR